MNDELHDPQIASMLGRASGAYPDANVAYVAVSGKVRLAKRRRALVAGSAACAMFLGVATVAAQSGRTDSQISPAATLTTGADDTEVSTTDVTTSVDDTPATSTDNSVESTTAETASTVVDEGSSSTSNTSGSGSGNAATGATTGSTAGSSTSNSTSNSSGGSAKPTVPAGPQMKVSPGGSLAFSNDGGTLTFVMATPAAGFDEDAGARVVEPHRVRVEFTDGTTTWRIEVRTEGGKMPVEVSQHD